MEEPIRKEIEGMGGDPVFVEFVLGWHGVIGATEVPFTSEKESPAYQKRINRWTRRDFGTQWSFYWRVIRDECWKARRKLVLKRNLFKMEPRGPNPSHRRRNEALWNAVFDLRNYFKQISKRPQMGLLCRLLVPDQLESTFRGEWDEHKHWFKDEKGAERLENLELFYKYNRARILETLRTGLPYYAKWES